MTSFELLQSLDKFLEIIDRYNDLFNQIRTLAFVAREISETLQQTLTIPSDQVLDKVQSAKSQLGKAVSQILHWDPAKVFVQLPNAKEALETFITSVRPVSQDNPISRIPSLLTNFSGVYSSLLRSSYSTPDLQRMLAMTFEVDLLLNDASKMMQFVQSRLSQESTIPDGCGELLLFMSSTDDLNTFLTKIVSVYELYQKLCELMEVSSQVFPLRIQRAEVGSLFLKLIGAKEVITWLGNLIERFVSYLYRNYTIEGKIESIPRKVEVIESVLKLRDELSRRGGNTDRLEAVITVGSLAIADGLTSLLEGEMYVNVNGHIYDVPTDVQKGLPEPQRQRLLNAPEAEDSGGEKGGKSDDG
jgi:hypothetical protein